MNINWRLARWWIAANAAGAVVALIVMGAVDALACCWLDSFIKVRSRALHGTISVARSTTAALPPARGAKR
jgi:hypothetical protein